MKRILGIALVGFGLFVSLAFLESSLGSIGVSSKLAWPLENGEDREKKLTFGLFVTPNPDQNPIDPPERFTGYHTALDLEIFEDEHTKEVPVFAACEGRVVAAQEAEGYGGVVVQSCRLGNQDITVLYGHLNFHAFKVKVGDILKVKDQISILGDEKSEESGFTRKHLHFGVHKGRELVFLGYVQTEAQLNNFLDPLPLLEKN